MTGGRATSTAVARRLVRALCALGAVLPGCHGDSGGSERISVGDAQTFESYVQPYLEVRCASLDCHGAAGRPLRLYSELGLRREPALRTVPVADATDPLPITAAELEDNRFAMAAIAAGDRASAEHLVLRKPLALAAGGIAHEGGVHWQDTRDPGYLCLRGYLEGGPDEDVAAACASALDAATTP